LEIPLNFNLGRRPQAEYIRTITGPSAWGGAIGMFSSLIHFMESLPDRGTGLCTQNWLYSQNITKLKSPVSTLKRDGVIDSVKANMCVITESLHSLIVTNSRRVLNQPSRAILLYSGIHYDAISLSPMPNAPLDFHTTVFPVSDAAILDGSLKLAGKLREKKKFTNTATFDLKCEICGAGLVGEKGAREHATATGHTSFGEY
jgi:hypothetical protein